MIKILPSLMAADQLNLEHAVKILEAYCDGFHMDIMDDHFVPNLSLSIDTINQLAKITNKQLSVHLMVDKPEEIIEKLHLKKNNVVAFHLESTQHPQELIKEIKRKNLLVSIALRPSTPIANLYPYLPKTDQVLIMTVEPGFSGQKIMPETIKKIEELSNYKELHSLFQPIAVDGGVKKDTIKGLVDIGVEIFSVGSAIFSTQDPVNAILELYKRARAE
jgi:ribulose-phosphate 3-epimerase